MDINSLKLFELIAIAVTTVATAHIVARLYLRYLKIEVLRYKCEFRFNQTVVYNEKLPEPVKIRLIRAFNFSKKSVLRMLFSGRPLKIEAWYSQEEIDAFFREGGSKNADLTPLQAKEKTE